MNSGLLIIFGCNIVLELLNEIVFCPVSILFAEYGTKLFNEVNYQTLYNLYSLNCEFKEY